MGNIQTTSDETRGVAKTKRSLRVKTRAFSRLMSSNSRRNTPRNALNYVTSGTDDVDEAVTEFSNVVFTKIPNQCALELDLSNDGGSDGSSGPQDVAHTTGQRSANRSPIAFAVGKKVFSFLFLFFFVIFVASLLHHFC